MDRKTQRQNQLDFSLRSIKQHNFEKNVFTERKKEKNSLYAYIDEFSNGDTVAGDFGCHDGSISYALSKRCRHVYGYDLEAVIGNNFLNPKDNLDFIGIDLDLDFPNHLFDLILALDVVEHLFNDKAFLLNCYLHLHKNGKLITTAPLHPPKGNIHFRGYEEDEFKAMLKKIGFSIVKEEKYIDSAGQQLILVCEKYYGNDTI